MSDIRRWVHEEAAKYSCEVIGFHEGLHCLEVELRRLGSQREAFGAVRIDGGAILAAKGTNALEGLVRHETEEVAIATYAYSNLEPGVAVICLRSPCPVCPHSWVERVDRIQWMYSCSRRRTDSLTTVHPLPERVAVTIGADNLFRVLERAAEVPS